MPNANLVILMGNTTRDIEIKYTPNGTAVGEVGIAVNRVWTDDHGDRHEETTFVDVTFWGRKAEIVGEYAPKGSPLYIEGYLKLDQWDDKQTGDKRSKLRVVCSNLQLLSRRQGEDEKPQKQSSRQPSKPLPKAPPRDPDLDVEDDDGIPF